MLFILKVLQLQVKGKNIYLAQRDNLHWEILFVQIFVDISFSSLDFDISNLTVFLADGNESHLFSNFVTATFKVRVRCNLSFVVRFIVMSIMDKC